MRLLAMPIVTALFLCCNGRATECISTSTLAQQFIAVDFSRDSWQYFLQHLPLKIAPILDYTGTPVLDQGKHVAIINYDVGNSDLQQCADALMRLRAEYLFAQHRYDEIGFHFCNGEYYAWKMYCDGSRPILNGNKMHWLSAHPCELTHESLRRYLNVVYAYANTISLAKELTPADKFEVGTVIITAGSPGHACIIIDEVSTSNGGKLYKLAEGYMPAQSIYVLSNTIDRSIDPWYRLQSGVISTSSYQFVHYQLGKFE